MTPAIGHTTDGRLVREHLPYARSASGQGAKRTRRRYTPRRVTLYRVWAYITAHPQHGLMRIVKGTRISRSCVWRALCELERRGVFVQEKQGGRRVDGARKIIEPFSWIEG